MASSSSSSSTKKSYMYDVFLSFRGIDTRKNFVDNLYAALQRHGIITYKDDKRLRSGRGINNQLWKAIEESKIFIIVFSKNYASSPWCLDELLKIMERQKATEQIAYPVFYDVNPFEVRHQLGSVGNAFVSHYNKRGVGKWREALKEAADLVGLDLRNTADGHEAEAIKIIVEKCLLELHFNKSNVDEKLIGMESRVKGILSSLEMGAQDVRMIGIKGIGGVGKTTLARAVFDSIAFPLESKIFIENVREASKMYGVPSLQKKIIFNLLNDKSFTIDGVHEGKNVLRKMFRGRKVLLVLDDVDRLEQLEALAGSLDWFKPGSRIIITTRDEQVLVAHGVKWIHDVCLLSQDEALFLFMKYSFRSGIPIQKYAKLSLQVVNYAAGLPLIIRVLASFLCGKDELEWEDALRRLKTIPLHETLGILELSYATLEAEYQEIFLDVACLLKGWKKDDAIRALESCGFYARTSLRVLEQKSLITISCDQQLVMHDRIQEMGHNIVRRSHPDDPRMHSRLWILEKIEDALADDLVTKATKAITINNISSDDKKNLYSKIVGKGFGNMTKLRFLHVEGDIYFTFLSVNVHQDLPNALRFLSWRGYPHCCLPKTFQGSNLVTLKMPHSKIRRLWEEGERKVLKNLRFLDFSYTELRSLDCSLFPKLEKLNLASCSDLIELHVPNGCLRNLVSLYLNHCWRFKSVSFIKQLKSLKVLDLSYLNLTEFPLHSNYSLLELNFSWNDIKEIPSSIGDLQKLVSLDFISCKNLKSLPQSICSLRSLKHLKLEGCKIQELPEDIGHLQSLETLDLMYSAVKVLPSSFCMLRHLKTLVLAYCKALMKLPEDLGLLKSLEELSLASCSKIRVVPSSICDLENLRKLDLSDCDQLEKLPENLGDLECLEVLDVRGTSLRPPPLKGVKILRPLNEEVRQTLIQIIKSFL